MPLAGIVLLSSEGLSAAAIGKRLGGSRRTVYRWRERFAESGAQALHWSLRLMANYAGVTQWRVQQVWGAADLKPHRLRTFKISFASLRRGKTLTRKKFIRDDDILVLNAYLPMVAKEIPLWPLV